MHACPSEGAPPCGARQHRHSRAHARQAYATVPSGTEHTIVPPPIYMYQAHLPYIQKELFAVHRRRPPASANPTCGSRIEATPSSDQRLPTSLGQSIQPPDLRESILTFPASSLRSTGGRGLLRWRCADCDASEPNDVNARDASHHHSSGQASLSVWKTPPSWCVPRAPSLVTQAIAP